MEKVTIYKFQLETILEALRITSNIHNCSEGKTCFDRQVRQAYEYSKNALEGNELKEYSSLKSYAEEHNCAIGSVGKALKKGTKCKGFYLKYKTVD